MTAKTLPVTLWRTFSRGRREDHTWRSFIDTFVRDPERVRDKRSVAGYSLAAFEGNRRSLPRVEHADALILDFDGGDTTIAQAVQLFPRTTNVSYTTHSHTPEWPKLRVVYLLSRPVSALEYSILWDEVSNRVVQAGHALDASARDASRFWYLPSHPPGKPYEWHETTGKPLDVDKVLAKAATASAGSGSTPSRTFPIGRAPNVPTGRPNPPGRVREGGDRPDAADSFFGRAFALAGMAFDSLENGALPVICPWASLHTSGVDGDTSTVVFAPTTEAAWGFFHCSHGHCVHRTTMDLLEVLPLTALEAARRLHGCGMVRARVIQGWMQRLEALPEAPALDRFVLKLRPIGAGDFVGTPFMMTVGCGSSMHLKYLDGLDLASLVGRLLDVSLEGKRVRAARLVPLPLPVKVAVGPQRKVAFR